MELGPYIQTALDALLAIAQDEGIDAEERRAAAVNVLEYDHTLGERDTERLRIVAENREQESPDAG